MRLLATSLTAAALLAAPLAVTPASADTSAPLGGGPVVIEPTTNLGDDTVTVTAEPAWTVEWPAATVAPGTDAVAYLHLPPAPEAVTFQMQRRIDGVWQDYMSYALGPHDNDYRVAFRLDTAVAGWTDYRIRQTTPTVLDSAVFRFTVGTPTDPTNPDAALTTVSVSRPSTATVKVGRKVTVTGTVTGGARPVVLEVKTATGWMPTKRATTTPTGSYTMKVPTTWYGKHTVRVVAAPTATHQQGVSESRTVTVKPNYKPRGTTSSWRALEAGARWNPCKVINFKTNLTGAPKGSLRNVKRAFKMIHAATGITFRYAGSTNKVPHSGGSNQFEDGTLIVAWTTPRRVPSLSGSVLGVGGSGWMGKVVNGRSVKEYIYGGVALDATDNKRLRNSFGRGQTQGALLLHEIAHAMGLDHINAKSQMMYPALTSSSLAKFGAGDLAGLRALGAAKGCL